MLAQATLTPRMLLQSGPVFSSADSIESEPSKELELQELLTVEDVAALLKVSRSWVYEHTRARGSRRAERLRFIKIGKYKRFDPRAVREFLHQRASGG